MCWVISAKKEKGGDGAIKLSSEEFHKGTVQSCGTAGGTSTKDSEIPEARTSKKLFLLRLKEQGEGHWEEPRKGKYMETTPWSGEWSGEWKITSTAVHSDMIKCYLSNFI